MKHFFIPCLLVFSLCSKAQNDTTVVVNLQHSKYDAKKKKKAPGEDNIIKIAPLGFGTGIFPVFGERVISDFFTVQAGLGLTGRNFLRNATQNLSDSYITPVYPWGSNSSIYDVSSSALTIDSKNTNPGEQKRKATMGYMVSIQPRIYFESDAPDSYYMGVSLDHYRYNFSLKSLQYNTAAGEYLNTGALVKEHENLTDIMITFGYQDVLDRFTVDCASSLGIRKVNGNKYYLGEDNSSGTVQVLEGLAPYKQSLFNYMINLRIGYHF